jgi:molybdopterin-guanine dinucleotide biosynthesis protein A
MDAYDTPVTTFRNVNEFCEPFLGIWSPKALERLQTNVEAGRLSSSRTIKQLNGKTILPISSNHEDCEWWLTNVNTKEEWEAAKYRLN